MLILADRALLLLFARFLVNDGLGFGNQRDGNRQHHVIDGVECAEEVDAFDGAVFAVVEMPTDQLTFVGIRFLLNAIITDQHAVGMLDVTNGGLDNLPEVSGSELALDTWPGSG